MGCCCSHGGGNSGERDSLLRNEHRSAARSRLALAPVTPSLEGTSTAGSTHVETQFAGSIGGYYKWKGFTPDRPIVVIPGFMASALEVRESGVAPEWKGRQIWLSLEKLGIRSVHIGCAREEETDHVHDDPHELEYIEQQKKKWLLHVMLDRMDGKSDPFAQGQRVEVRAVPGHKGTDFIQPGALAWDTKLSIAPLLHQLQVSLHKRSEAQGKQPLPVGITTIHCCHLPSLRPWIKLTSSGRRTK